MIISTPLQNGKDPPLGEKKHGLKCFKMHHLEVIFNPV